MAAELPKEQQLSVEKLIECCKLSARWMGEGMRELNREVSLAYANYQHGPSFDFYLKRLGKLIAEDLSLGSNEDKPHVRVMTEVRTFEVRRETSLSLSSPLTDAFYF